MWLVDPLRSTTKMHKFLGTLQAGSNTDMAGMTCDVFAHFSLHDSEGHLVFVDIQGMFISLVININLNTL